MRSVLQVLHWLAGCGSATISEKQPPHSNMSAENLTESDSFGATMLPSYSKTSLPTVSGLSETQQIVLREALDGLFSASFFDVCKVNDILEMCRVPRESDAYKMLRTLHCKHYNAMSTEMRERLPLIVRDALMPQRCEATDVVLNGLVIERVKP